MTRSYLDYNATAPALPEVQEAHARALALTGNPSSVHAEGRRVRAMIEDARRQVAALVGVASERVVFTSGGSEANMTALAPENGAALEGVGQCARCLVSQIEHPSVLAGGRFQKEKVSSIAVDGEGRIKPSALETELAASPEPALVSVMLANNETGVLQPIAEIAECVRSHGGLLHSDMVQAVGRVAIDMGATRADLASFSAHKIGGPQGVGALVLGERLDELKAPLIAGGSQENRRRAGTENVAGIVGFGVAAECASDNLRRIGVLAQLRERLERGICEIAPKAVIFSREAERLANTTCFAQAGMSAETLVIAFDLAGVSLSAGAACSSGKVERSHVLEAMGVPEMLAAAAVRVSLGHGTQERDVEHFLSAWREIYEAFEARRRAA